MCWFLFFCFFLSFFLSFLATSTLSFSKTEHSRSFSGMSSSTPSAAPAPPTLRYDTVRDFTEPCGTCVFLPSSFLGHQLNKVWFGLGFGLWALVWLGLVWFGFCVSKANVSTNTLQQQTSKIIIIFITSARYYSHNLISHSHVNA